MPSFDDVNLTTDQLAFCQKILSSDALAAMIVSRVKNGQPTSVIRMSDGERAYMAAARGQAAAHFMKDPRWLKRYGLTGADARAVGRDLLWAGEHADFLACTISGVFWDTFVVHPYFPERRQFIDQFYPQLWQATDRVGAVLRAGPSLVLHREHESIIPPLRDRYGLTSIDGRSLDSWKDHTRLIDELSDHQAKLVLVSGGAAGKAFIVRLAERTGKVVLDVGEAMQGCWVKSTMQWDAAGKPIR